MFVLVTCIVASRPFGAASAVAQAQVFQPDVIGGDVAAIRLLAQQQLADDGVLRPSVVVTSGGPLTELTRQYIRRAFAVDPINLYAAAEGLALGADCPHGDGMHLFEDANIFETVGEDFQHLARGAAGQVLLTSLYNRTLPLIRYQLGDQLRPHTRPCSCGSVLANVAAVAPWRGLGHGDGLQTPPPTGPGLESTAPDSSAGATRGLVDGPGYSISVR